MVEDKKIYPEKKIAIFDAAIKLIAEDGFKSPTAKIAEEAGVGTGTLYWYFKSKDQLIDELFQYIEEEMNIVITQNISPEEPVSQKFIQLCKKFIRFAFDNPRKFNFFNQYIDSPYGAAMRKYKHYRDSDNIPPYTLLFPFYKLFNEGKEQHLIKDLQNILLFTLIYGAISNFVRDTMIGVIDYSKEAENNVVEICWDSVKK